MKNKLFCALLFAALISSCATLQKPNDLQKSKQLQMHLQSWQHFRIDGIIQVNHNNLILRKNVTFRKNENILRLDIFDTGFLGLSPTPFLSVSLDSTLIIRNPNNLKIPLITRDDFLFFLEISELLKYQNEIITNKKVKINGYEFNFTENYEISQIVKNSNLVKFQYAEFITAIAFQNNESVVAEISIDTINFNKPNIPKLK
ncbi:MAG: hypothetical protein HN952_01480 [Candidatus Cloacimonetes bacterium]|jgi:hypothetical protein|nr:hypothetical protein [Candidatus Cloacimonadota bacterium]MBT6993605.1 hypothetical protein [Candidatus Cloacimonadota bacterium]